MYLAVAIKITLFASHAILLSFRRAAAEKFSHRSRISAVSLDAAGELSQVTKDFSVVLR